MSYYNRKKKKFLLSSIFGIVASVFCAWALLLSFASNSFSETIQELSGVKYSLNGKNAVIIKWNKVLNASSYNIYRSIYENQSYQKINVTPIVGNSYKDLGLKYNSKYYYKVTALYKGKEIKRSGSIAVKTGTVMTGQTGVYNVNPPEKPVRLVFIHHSTGEHWLADQWGKLGLALKDNNYFVSDTNYGWGPDHIGDFTDIGNWWSWFRGPNSEKILKELYANSDKHSKACYANMDYSQIETIPKGENEIIMMKSCFPNSYLRGKPNDQIPSILSNPLKGNGCGSEMHNIANAKGIYVDLLNYFKIHQEKLFIIVTAPPMQDGTFADNARAFNNWLVNDWLQDYPYRNVFVFDFYNILTSNLGDAYHNDLGEKAGNHHRLWDGEIQHQVDKPKSNTLVYADSKDDDHPNIEGNDKATKEFLPLLNVVYNAWKEQKLN